MPEEYRIDTGAIYHQLSLADLQLEVPQIDWLRYFATVLSEVPFNREWWHDQDRKVLELKSFMKILFLKLCQV